MITKAVIAVAGYGTRFLPATKNIPKQMLPIIDKPIIQYLVEEAVESGITDIILVTQAGQSSMEDHFDSHVALEHVLEQSHKFDYLEKIRKITKLANFIYLRQRKHLPYGTASPLLVAKNIIGKKESFVYMFGDDMVKSKIPATKQLIDTYNKERPAAVIGVQEMPWEEIYKYGSVKYRNKTKNFQIEELVEKADKETAFSNMAVFGRFVFSADVIREAEKTPVIENHEFYLTDVLNRLAKREKVIAKPVKGKWLTTGDPLNYLKATVEYALDRDDLKEDFGKYLKQITAE